MIELDDSFISYLAHYLACMLCDLRARCHARGCARLCGELRRVLVHNFDNSLLVDKKFILELDNYIREIDDILTKVSRAKYSEYLRPLWRAVRNGMVTLNRQCELFLDLLCDDENIAWRRVMGLAHDAKALLSSCGGVIVLWNHLIDEQQTLLPDQIGLWRHLDRSLKLLEEMFLLLERGYAPESGESFTATIFSSYNGTDAHRGAVEYLRERIRQAIEASKFPTNDYINLYLERRNEPDMFPYISPLVHILEQLLGGEGSQGFLLHDEIIEAKMSSIRALNMNN